PSGGHAGRARPHPPPAGGAGPGRTPGPRHGRRAADPPPRRGAGRRRMSRQYTQSAAYQSVPRGPLDLDTALYDRIARAERTSIEQFEIPIRSGRAWEVPAGSIVRLSTVEGPQVGGLNMWNLHNPRERFWTARTRQLHRSSMTTHDRFWSTLPHLRPLAT